MRTSGYVSAFTAGEIGPDAWERSDLQQHAKGCASALNFLCQTVGPLVSRGGFWDRGAALDETKAGRVFGFARSNLDSLMLEFSDLAFRVWTAEGDPVLDGPDQVVVTTPWTAEQLDALWLRQVGDVVFVTSQAGLPPKVIKRLSNVEWEVVDFDFRDGPWLPENVDAAFTFQASAVRPGAATITFSQPILEAGHLQARFRIRAQSSGAGMGGWSAGYDVKADNEMLVSDGRIYRTTTQAADYKTGTNPPVHERGIASDGEMNWEFLHEGSGIVQIEGGITPTTANVTILSMLPTHGSEVTVSNSKRRVLSGSANPALPATMYWAEEAFSEVQGWPTAPVEEHNERLIWGGTVRRPSTLWLTRIAGFGPDYGDFKPGRGTGLVADDDAVRMTVGKAGAPVVWVRKAVQLVAATTDGEWLVHGGEPGQPITPDSNGTTEISAFGAWPCEPALVHGPPIALLFVTRSGQCVRELQIAPDLATDGDDVTILASHIAERGFFELAWQHPDEVCWARLQDGGLAAFTYHQKHGVRAWTSQALPDGFEVESIATVPAFGGGDVLWALVRRDKDGTMQRRLWLLSRRSELMFLDGAERYDGAPVTVVSGLDHLEGETVAIVADGARVADQAVSEGTVTLPYAASVVDVGLKVTRRFESLPLDLQGVGSTIGRTFRAEHAMVTLYAVEADIGTDADASHSRVERRPPGNLAAPAAVRIKERVTLGGGADRDRRVVISTDAPYDLQIRSIRTEGNVTP